MSIDEVVEVARQGQQAGLQGGAVHARGQAGGPLPGRPASGWTRAGTTRPWPTCEPLRSRSSRPRACSLTSTLACSAGPTSPRPEARVRVHGDHAGVHQRADSMTKRGMPHHNCPDKLPAVRLQMLEDAGRHSVPFTSGILIGIGETAAERVDAALMALAATSKRYGHLQEVIVQNFRAKPRHGDAARPRSPTVTTCWPRSPWPACCCRRACTPCRRRPTSPPRRRRADRSGGHRRLGRGLARHPRPREPRGALAAPGRADRADRGRRQDPGRAAVCVYPEYVKRPDPWLAPGQMRTPVQALATPEGLGRDGHVPARHSPGRPPTCSGARRIR